MVHRPTRMWHQEPNLRTIGDIAKELPTKLSRFSELLSGTTEPQERRRHPSYDFCPRKLIWLLPAGNGWDNLRSKCNMESGLRAAHNRLDIGVKMYCYGCPTVSGVLFHGPTFGKLNSAYNVAVVKKRRLEVLVGRARVPKFRRMAGHGSRDRNVGDVNRQMTVDRNFSE